IRIPEPVARHLGDYLVHPALLDGCLQVHQGTLPFAGEGRLDAGTYVPRRAEQFRRYRPLAAARFYCHFRVRPEPGGGRGPSDVRAVDEAGQVLWEVRGLRSVRIGAAARDDEDRPD